METSSKRNAAIPVSSSTTPDLVYHYTTANTFRRIIEGKSLRFGHVRPQNDRQEVTYFQDLAYDYLRSEMQKSSERRAELQPLCTPLLFDIRTPMATRDDIPDGYRSYLVCFSEEGDLKSQWNHYADNFRGLAIGFRPSQFIGCGFERLDNSFGNSIGLFGS